MKITYIGHGSTAIEVAGQFFLTDPLFSKKVFGIKRNYPAGLSPETMPQPTAILISHAHYDHLDLFSFKYFKTTIPILAPKGIGGFIRKFLPNPIVEIKPWSHHLQQNLEIHTVPVRHHGWRWIPWRYRAATAYVIKTPEGNVYFAGDTGPGPHFKETAATFPIDVALLPIGGYHPRWIHKRSKLDPQAALTACRELQAKRMVPIDWGSFGFLGEKPEEPLEILQKKITEGAFEDRVKILAPGQSLDWPER